MFGPDTFGADTFGARTFIKNSLVVRPTEGSPGPKGIQSFYAGTFAAGTFATRVLQGGGITSVPLRRARFVGTSGLFDARVRPVYPPGQGNP